MNKCCTAKLSPNFSSSWFSIATGNYSITGSIKKIAFQCFGVKQLSKNTSLLKGWHQLHHTQKGHYNPARRTKNLPYKSPRKKRKVGTTFEKGSTTITVAKNWLIIKEVKACSKSSETTNIKKLRMHLLSKVGRLY